MDTSFNSTNFHSATSTSIKHVLSNQTLFKHHHLQYFVTSWTPFAWHPRLAGRWQKHIQPDLDSEGGVKFDVRGKLMLVNRG